MNEHITRFITALFLIAITFGAYLLLPAWALSIGIVVILLVILCVEWPLFHAWYLTPLYPISPFIFLILLNHTYPRWLFLLTISMVAAHDTGAYYSGKIFGTHKLCPSISPGKTWEGFIGGCIISLVITMGISCYFQLPLRGVKLIILTIFINSVALMGDLFESYLKRRAYLKDSGNLLPGHGGFLDRFDSLLFAGTAMYIVYWLLL